MYDNYIISYNTIYICAHIIWYDILSHDQYHNNIATYDIIWYDIVCYHIINYDIISYDIVIYYIYCIIYDISYSIVLNDTKKFDKLSNDTIS